MTRKKTSAGFQRQGYHHGNLKEALVAAARELIAQRGVAGFTLIDAAKMAGVSAAAPYRHFKDREALIKEVAARGFAEFAKRLGGPWKGAGPEPFAGFSRMGQGYLAFAREEPGYYAAMFSGLHQPPPSGDPAFGGLREAIAKIGDVAGLKLDARQLAYLVWALSHGIATLSAVHRIPNEDEINPEALLRAGVLALIRGAAMPGGSVAERATGPGPAIGRDAPGRSRS